MPPDTYLAGVGCDVTVLAVAVRAVPDQLNCFAARERAVGGVCCVVLPFVCLFVVKVSADLVSWCCFVETIGVCWGCEREVTVDLGRDGLHYVLKNGGWLRGQ